MIYQHTWRKVLNGEKTQTRRIVKPNQCLSSWSIDEPFSAVIQRKGEWSWRDVYRVDNTYAVQPGRGKPAIARIRILRIWREDVRDITEEDAQAEGFYSRVSFWHTWTRMHDKDAWEPQYELIRPEFVKKYIAHRPADRYDAWALEFELVQP